MQSLKCLTMMLRHESNLFLGVHDALHGVVDVGDAVLARQQAGGQGDAAGQAEVRRAGLGSGESLGSAALPHVFLQGAGDAEWHVAEPALHDVFASPAVCLHVSC